MDVCVFVYSVFLLSCVRAAAFRRAEHSSKESYRLCIKDYETEEKKVMTHERAVQPLMNELIGLYSKLFASH
jgi:hypothetical protein